MSGGDLPPRQKMIGMMYLVLTALLAMNVSKDILDAFIVVNSGIENSTESFADKTSSYYAKFASAAQEDPKSVPFRDNANKVKQWSDDLYNHIAELKKQLIKQTDKLDDNAHDSLFHIKNVQSKDNYDTPTLVMGLAEPSLPKDGEWSALDLKNRFNKFSSDIAGIFKGNKEAEEAMNQVLAVLETPDPPKGSGDDKNWESANFYHVPLAAVITILSKMQSDVRSVEAEAVALLYQNIDAEGVTFTKVDGFAFAKKAYVMDGDSFAAQIFTAAYDDQQDPEIFIGKYDSALVANNETDETKIMKGSKGETWEDFKKGGWFQLKDVQAGKGYLKIKEGIGVHEWKGIIKVKTKKGPKIYPFEHSFEVGKPSTTVAAEKMNVFYIGVDNPVSVSAPMPNFTASAPGLSKTAKGYVMRPSAGAKTVTIVVTGTDDNGNKVNLGKSEFRVKRIPDPVSSIMGKSGSTSIKKAEFAAASTVQAKMDNFDFEVRVNVSSFVFSTTDGGLIQEVKVNGNSLNAACKAMIQKAKRNQKFFIEKVQVKMPDGTTRQLAPIILQVI
ncbi:MAG: gliding motility protein GldM [Vicingaceae bacterium]|nr:gliding motility protein GldM [Vicingaceae bacterium]